jgi:hypothetical protein
VKDISRYCFHEMYISNYRYRPRQKCWNLAPESHLQKNLCK